MSSFASPHLLHKSYIVSLLIIVILAVGCGTADNTNTISNANTATNNTTTATPDAGLTGSPNVTIVNANTSANASNTRATSNTIARRTNGNENGNVSGNGAQNSNNNAGTAGEIPMRDEIAEQLRKLPWGEIARDIPREMRVGESKPVRVYISKMITNNPSSGVPEVAQVSKVKLAPVMGAFLISADGNAFDIARVYPKDKVIPKETGLTFTGLSQPRLLQKPGN